MLNDYLRYCGRTFVEVLKEHGLNIGLLAGSYLTLSIFSEILYPIAVQKISRSKLDCELRMIYHRVAAEIQTQQRSFGRGQLKGDLEKRLEKYDKPIAFYCHIIASKERVNEGVNQELGKR